MENVLQQNSALNCMEMGQTNLSNRDSAQFGGNSVSSVLELVEQFIRQFSSANIDSQEYTYLRCMVILSLGRFANLI